MGAYTWAFLLENYSELLELQTKCFEALNGRHIPTMDGSPSVKNNTINKALKGRYTLKNAFYYTTKYTVGNKLTTIKIVTALSPSINHKKNDQNHRVVVPFFESPFFHKELRHY